MRVRIGEQSEIQVRSEAVALGYLLDGAVVSGLDAGGWYHTHDAGSLAAGVLRVGRRIRPPMCIGRTPVDPEELEATIVRVPGVREAVVLPVQRGDTAHVRAVVATSLDARVLAERLTTALPPDRLPKEIEVVDALPKSPAGKVLQKYLV
jgi:acyl-CoA synthetase (AMP-forming)/AMP-acid ligase II